jgi:hypothetical protein
VTLLELPPPDFAAFLDERSDPTTAEALRGRVVGGLFACWRSLRPVAGYPSRADLDPIELGRLLPHLALVDVTRSAALPAALPDLRRDRGRDPRRRRHRQALRGGQVAATRPPRRLVRRTRRD